MSKPLLGLVLGAVLGAIDGVSALAYEGTASQIVPIIMGSTFKGLLTGVLAGWIARRWRSVPLGIAAGLVIGFGLSAWVGSMSTLDDGTPVFWPIVIPGTLLGAIVGFATQRFGRAPAQAPVRHHVGAGS